MPISFSCPECGLSYKVAESQAGKHGKCKQCGSKLTVPGTEPPPAPPDAYELDETDPAPSRETAVVATASAPPRPGGRSGATGRSAVAAGGERQDWPRWPVALAGMGVVVLVATLAIVLGRSGSSRKAPEKPSVPPTALPRRPAEPEAQTAPTPEPPKPVAESAPSLKRDGAFGFPQAQAQILCDQKDLRVSVWNNAEYLYVQAIVWGDDDDAVAKDKTGRLVGDHSRLLLDLDADQARTPQVDRSYSLNAPYLERPGLSYFVAGGKEASTGFHWDSQGRGAIRYLDAGDGRRVRVDGFVILLSEIQKRPGEKIGLIYVMTSPQPSLQLHSVRYEHDSGELSELLPMQKYHAVTLSERTTPLDFKQAPEGREDTNRGALSGWSPGYASHVLFEGSKLTDDQARALEDALKSKPDELESRVKLLGFYRTGQKPPEAKKARQAHVIWLIENQPRNPVAGMGHGELNFVLDGDAYTRAMALWDKHVEANPKDVVILGNAAAFLLQGHEDEAKTLLERCRALEPENRVWPEKIGGVLLQKMRASAGKARRQFAVEAVKELELELELGQGKARASWVFTDIAKASFEAGDYAKAKDYATKGLDGVSKAQTVSFSGDAIHDGNLVLGRLAVIAGDVAAAKRYLLAAGKTPGSANLNSFGPNMSLAKDLLERRESRTVLEYFDLCAKFWRLDQGRLVSWRDAVKAGKAPDFGGNLNR